MGRDVVGPCFDKKPIGVDVSPKNLPEEVEMEDYGPDDHKQHSEGANHETEEKIFRAATDDSGEHSSNRSKKSQSSSSSTSTEPQHFHNKDAYDEDDNCSLASSSATSVRSNKFRVTVPVAPRFTCDERLERRKEYYTKLEEKHKALERARVEQEARSKEEEQSAIKQLRKGMVYKANPIPSFYREGHPPKVDLKKLPVTRAKSPKLARRKSCGDAGKISPDDVGLIERATCHSISIYSKGKNQVGTPKSNKNSKVEDHPEEH